MRLRFVYEVHQFVVSGMKLNYIDPVSKPIMRSKLRQISVCQSRKLLRLCTTDLESGPPKSLLSPTTAKSVHRLDERFVIAVGIVVRKRTRLVEHLVRRVTQRIGKELGSVLLGDIRSHACRSATSPNC